MKHNFTNHLSIATVILLALLFGLAPVSGQSQPDTMDPPQALQEIEASILAGHVSFLSASRMRGRPFGSWEEAIAAEYIAAQFRTLGLRSPWPETYSQTVELHEGRPNGDSWHLGISCGDRVLELPSEDVSPRLDPIRLEGASVFKISGDPLDPSLAEGLDLDGAAVFTMRSFSTNDEWLAGRRELRSGFDDAARAALEREVDSLRLQVVEENSARLAFLSEIQESGAVVHLDGSRRASTWRWDRLDVWDPTDQWTGTFSQGPFWEPELANFRLHGDEVIALFESLPAGQTNCTTDINLGPPIGEPVATNNVVGLIPGSDPELSSSYVLVSAHYDGQEPWPGLGPDSIRNSANDNATGVAAAIEVARALMALPQRPRRSVLFVAFGGEEEGGLGSQFFVNHPPVPLEAISAMANLEMLGRIDDTFEGTEPGRFFVTGLNYSSMPEAFQKAGERYGVTVAEHSRSDEFFSRSDNLSFAKVGIPAHTIAATFNFPDYHGSGDDWEKNDFENMALLTRSIALGIWYLANADGDPTWNSSSQEAQRFIEAQQVLRGRRR
jgi:hypothetical protein